MDASEEAESYYTLLGIRADGVASVVDVVMAALPRARARARDLLSEHASCISVEVWREANMVDRLARDG